MGDLSPTPIVTLPGGGERFERDDRTITILGELPQIFALLLEVEPGWPGIGVHEHGDHVDTFFVLEGEAGIVAGDDVVPAGAGSFAAAVPGARHGVTNEPGGPYRLPQRAQARCRLCRERSRPLDGRARPLRRHL